MHLLNPLNKTVSTTRAYDDGSIKTITLEPESITTFDDETTFNHMRDYLVEIVLNERGIVHYDHERTKVRNEVVKEL